MPGDFFKWAYLVGLLVISAVRKTHERRAGRRSSLKDTPILESLLMMAWGIAAGILPPIHLFSSWLDFADYPMPVASGFLGIALFVVATWMLHRSHADLGKRWSPTIEMQDRQGLVTEGVYRQIRHPMYSAHLLWAVAQLLLVPNFIAGLLALPLILGLIVVRVPREEKIMLDEFGDSYRAYMSNTKRVIPGII